MMALPDAEAAQPREKERVNGRPKSYADAVEREVAVDEGTSAKGGGLTNGRRKGDGEDGEEKVGGTKGGEGEKTEGQSEAAWVEDVKKSYAAAAADPPPSQDTHQQPLHTSPATMLPSAPSTTSFRSGYGEQFEDTEFEDTEVFENIRDHHRRGERLVSIKSPPCPQATTSPTRLSDRTLVSGREAGATWHQSPIRFAPLNVPLQRRLQTAVVLLHTFCIAGGISLFLFLCAIPILWPLIVPYLVYVMFSSAGTSGELSYRSARWRRSKIWSLFAGYFPARLHRTTELSATRKYIFGYHPHGIISHGAFAAFGTEALGFAQLFPGITNSLLTLDSNFRIPLYREYALFLGMASVSRRSCENLLSKGGVNGEGMGRAITIVVGGARESLDARPRTLRLVLGRRHGFVKMALRMGADLVPVLGFGENELYDQVSAEGRPWIRRAQDVLRRTLGWTLPLFHARGVFNYDVGIVPYRRPVNVVVGRPIAVRQNRKPTVEEVEELHRLYCEELVRLWETWKDDFAPDRVEEMRILD